VGTQMRSHIHGAILAKKWEPPPLPAEKVEFIVQEGMRETERVYPAFMQELRGTSAGAGVSVYDLFYNLYEELWDKHSKVPDYTEERDTGCTDLVVTGKASYNGKTYLAHTNDEDPVDGEAHLMTFHFDDRSPSVRGVSIGIRPFSVVQNSAGLIQTGNTLIPQDVRPGIPRMVMVRLIMTASTIDDALKLAMLPERSSMYNTILADHTGRVVNLEGSATDARMMPLVRDRLVHSNHFLVPEMVRFEAKHDTQMSSTRIRHRVASRLLYAHDYHTPESLRRILQNHEGYPADSICRHGKHSRTLFACIYEAETGKLWLHKGTPCLWVEPLPF